MIKQVFLLIFFISALSFLKAQETITIVGNVSFVETGKMIESVHIKVNQQNIITRTNFSGGYKLVLQKKKKNITLVFSHIGYETVYEPIDMGKDTVVLNVSLKKKVETIPEFEVEGNSKPVIVFKSGKINVADYEFYEDRFLFLVYGKRLNKDSEIYLVDKNEQIVSKHFVPGVPVELLYVKIHGLQKLKIRRYTKLVSNLVDCCFFLNSFWLKKPKNTFL